MWLMELSFYVVHAIWQLFFQHSGYMYHTDIESNVIYGLF